MKISLVVASVIGSAGVALASATGDLKQLSGHVPSVVSRLTAVSLFSSTNRLALAIGLPLHNRSTLETLLKQINDPASPNYHHYLNPDQFTAQFGPTEQEYQQVVAFAKASGLTVKATHANRMILEVEGTADKVQSAFQVTLHLYQHPTENRLFFAPDTEPSVPAGLFIQDVSGLNNYSRPHSHLHQNPNPVIVPAAGSGPSGSYRGNDFRAAYVPGTPLTGSGQNIALVQFDGYLASDIALYEQRAGLPSVTLQNILLNGFSGIPTGNGGEVEVSLDIEMVISMAPGLNKVYVYEGNPNVFNPNVVLNRIATDNVASQVSCSWGWTGGPNATSDQIFLQMAAQGQSFFNASGDSDAFLPGQVDDPTYTGYPSSSPYVTEVGGTTLRTTGPGGQRRSEQVWNWGNGQGSSGGYSSYYPIPPWQQGISMSNNHGSTTFRNIPDVALTADNVDVIADNGIDYPTVGGTSCAAPLWAGFMALVNQQASNYGKPAAGFINPAIYALAKTPAYNSAFFDITNGNNTWPSSPANFFAVQGYDLCTGLGTPNGTNFINALVSISASNPPTISAPLAPWGSSFSVMNGSNPNGPWFLFVQDDKPFDVGVISNGWALTLTTANPVGYAADNQLYVTPTIVTNITNGSWKVNLAVTNYGPSDSAGVSVVDTVYGLGAGITLSSSNLTAGVIAVVANKLNWNIGSLAVNTGATLDLNFLVSAAGSYTNTAYVQSTTYDPNPDDDGGTCTVTAQAASLARPVLTPNFMAGGGVGGGFQLSVANVPGQTVIIEVSTNLVAASWTPVYTNVQPFIFTNFNATNYPMQFYRARTSP